MASEALKKELECSVCLNIFTDPVTLKCGHSYCRECIDQVLDTQGGPGGYSCPECREKFQERPSLQRNIRLHNIVESLPSAQPDPRLTSGHHDSNALLQAEKKEARNLIKNHCGERGFEGWEILENGGDGWKVETVPGEKGAPFPDDSIKKYFVTSFARCSKKQVIDLIAEGYTRQALDAQPHIEVTDWYCARTDAACVYELHVQLLSECRHVIKEYHSGVLTLPKCSNSDWNKINHLFSGYGQGVRYVSFKHGGKDSPYWKGWYGVRVTNSSVTVGKVTSRLCDSKALLQAEKMARNLIKNNCGERGFEGWEILENGGDGWKVETVPGEKGALFPYDNVKKYFVTSFARCSKKQVIDLLAEGYTRQALDAQPHIVITDWFSARTDAACVYDLSVQLLSQYHHVLEEYNSGVINLPKCSNSVWKKISHTFSGYGPGVRYITFKHGGKDTPYWKGWYGVRVTNSSVTVGK